MLLICTSWRFSMDLVALLPWAHEWSIDTILHSLLRWDPGVTSSAHGQFPCSIPQPQLVWSPGSFSTSLRTFSVCVASNGDDRERVAFWSFPGFYHEQSRPDRDDYVSIQWDNIQPGSFSSQDGTRLENLFTLASIDNFQKYNVTEVDTLMTSYDYASVMHYDRNAFAINSSAPTIIPTQNRTAFIGQRVRLSPTDILEIQRYYGCVPTPEVSTTTATSSAPTDSTTVTITTTTTIEMPIDTTASTLGTNTRRNTAVVCPSYLPLVFIFSPLIWMRRLYAAVWLVRPFQRKPNDSSLLFLFIALLE